MEARSHGAAPLPVNSPDPSGAPGLTVGQNIGLGYVPRDLAKIGTALGIEIRNKVVDAEVVKTPFYKREGA